MANFHYLLVNIFSIMFPLTIITILWLRKRVFNWQKNKIYFVLVYFMVIFLCILFPYRLETGFSFDLRTIPLILVILYAGYKAGILLTLGLFVISYFISPSSLWVHLIIYSLFTPTAIFLRRYYLRSSLQFKYVLFYLLTLLPIVIMFGIGISMKLFSVIFGFDFLFFAIVYALVNLLVSWSVVNTIENFFAHIEMVHHFRTSEKNQLVADMAASFAHEIRNPMTVVHGFVQMLSRGEVEPEKRKIYHQLMEDELKRAESILNAYLSFSKPYDEEQETILITKQLREIVEIMTPYSQLNNVELHLHKNEKADQLRFIANKVEFNQVFINIIKNGVESIKENGQIDITVEHEKRDIKISIKDTGVGMDKEQLDKLFNFYYSKKKDGTGIGLAVCNHIIQSFRGRIKVKSEEGKGAEFIILLPYD